MAILLFHGSDHEFDEFSFEKVGTESGISGAGFGLYFTMSNDALAYGKFVYTCLLELQNNLSNNTVTLQEHIIHAIIKEIENSCGISYFDLIIEKSKNKIVRELIYNKNSDTDIIKELTDICFNGDCSEMLPILSGFGFTHTTDNVTPDDPTITHYIVYDLDSITIQKVESLEDMGYSNIN